MKIKNSIMNFIIIICMSLSYWIIDFGIRYLSYDSYKFYHYKLIAPTLFTLVYVSIFIGIFYLLDKKKRKIFYIISIICFNLIGISQYLHFKILERFYSISDLFLIKEGSKYFKYAIFNIDIKILTIVFISILFSIIALILSKTYHETYRDKLYFIFIIAFTTLCSVSFFICGYLRLGKEANNAYDSSFNGLNVYKEFNNPNKNMQVVGLYENISRGLIIYIKDKLSNNEKKLKKEIESYIKNNNKILETNEYTGILKDKNIIVIMTESLESFLITEKIMPTLYKLKNEGLNFTNRYAPAFGGGQTINSEFAINTGLYSSLDGNIFNYNNTYKNSLANKFKNLGYEVNSIHFNYGYYYNRSDFHKNLGYTKHYALLDMKDLNHDKYNYEYDTSLMEDEIVRDLIVRDNKFLSFITTYSTHLPYDENSANCNRNQYNLKANKNKELTCIYNITHNTDEMLRLLLKRLEEKNILDNTVIVLASDHYMYGYSKIEEVKKTNNSYLIQHTPLIIWSSNLNHKEVDVPVDTADILPTILNLFGIEYDPNLYVGEDIFSQNRNNYIYFTEDIYYKNNTLYDRTNSTGEIEIYKEIKEIIKFNNNLIETNYLKTTN